MTSVKTVAEFLTQQLRRRGGVLYQNDAAEWILARFGRDGREFISKGQGTYQGYFKIREDVRREFRVMNPDVGYDHVIAAWTIKRPGTRCPGA